MRIAHEMPFGAEVSGEGVRFSLWAPAARRVCLHVEDRPPRPMVRGADGFYTCFASDARAGDRYSFSFDGEPLRVADPASRFNPDGVHGPSQVVDPAAFEWQDDSRVGWPWRNAVFYELHVGAFTPEGTFAAAETKLEYLAALGVTAVELMPVADGPGRRNWGYDGVLPFAVRPAYGRPEDLKRFVQSAHRAGLMVFLDVVYNHFGPEGNYLHRYAPQFFTDRHKTPWGDAINFDGPESAPVREFFIHNALCWLEEYRFDGLRLDAVHAIIDDSEPDFLTELAAAVRRLPGGERHLVLENGDNEARYLARGEDGRPRRYAAQWNDDFHHAAHVLLTSEKAGYYEDYEQPGRQLLRCLTEGFVYQGEPSKHWGGRPRGEPSAHLPPDAFVSFLQNHDQIGNRAHGERLWMLAERASMRAAETLLLLLPAPILLFMGDEFHAPNRFPFFCDFEGQLADAVTQGRRMEFAHFFENVEDLASIPDPNDEATLGIARLDWSAAARPEGTDAIERYTRLLALRRDVLMPLLPAGARRGRMLGDRALHVEWALGQGATLVLVANFSALPAPLGAWPDGELVHSSVTLAAPRPAEVPPWCASWFIRRRT